MTYWIESSQGERYEIPADTPVTIGRTSRVTIRLSDRRVSRVHCMVYRRGGQVTVSDLGSRNGTTVSGESVQTERIWSAGEVLTLEPGVAEFLLRGEEASSSGESTDRPAPQVDGVSPTDGAEADNSAAGPADDRAATDTDSNPSATFSPAGSALLSLVLVWLIVSQAVFFGQTFRVFAERSKRTPAHSEARLSTASSEIDIAWLRTELGEDDVPADGGFLAAVEAEIARYQHLPDFRRALERRDAYRGDIEGVFESYNVPWIFTLIPIVESYFYPQAWNRRTDARGMWQFRPPTAREYGLVITANRDDRLDPVASSDAAARYVLDLLGVLGYESVALVAAAYNAGDGRVRYALRQVTNPETERSFWHLSQQRLIPQETRGYVPRLYAAAILVRRHDENEARSR